jgi:hypothetical protein
MDRLANIHTNTAQQAKTITNMTMYLLIRDTNTLLMV